MDCRQCKREYERRWRADHPDRVREKGLKYREEHREQALAAAVVQQRVRRGTMTREPCEVCGAEPAHGHHDDYSKPAEVRWLCPQHHAEVHQCQL